MLLDEAEIENRHRALLEEPIGLQLLGAIGLCADIIAKNSLTLSNASLNELVCSSLGVHIRNNLSASVKLAGAGYFSAASGQLRYLAEAAQLLEYFARDPKSIGEWLSSSGKTRYNNFGFSKIRKLLLDKHRIISRWEERFHFHSEYGIHPSVGSALAIHSEDGWQTGPHYDKSKFQGIVLDVANDACMAIDSYIASMDSVSHTAIADKLPEELRLLPTAQKTVADLYTTYSKAS